MILNTGKMKNGVVQIPILIGLLIMAIAVPVATRLVQNNTENRGQAASDPCSSYSTQQVCSYYSSCRWTGSACVTNTSPTSPPVTYTCTTKGGNCVNGVNCAAIGRYDAPNGGTCSGGQICCGSVYKVNCAWSNWGPCSASCGGGTQTRYKNPPASGGGTDCSGGSTQSCNTQPCPTNTPKPTAVPTQSAPTAAPRKNPFGMVNKSNNILGYIKNLFNSDVLAYDAGFAAICNSRVPTSSSGICNWFLSSNNAWYSWDCASMVDVCGPLLLTPTGVLPTTVSSPNKFCCCRTGFGVDAPEVCVWWDKTCASSGLKEASLKLKCENAPTDAPKVCGSNSSIFCKSSAPGSFCMKPVSCSPGDTRSQCWADATCALTGNGNDCSCGGEVVPTAIPTSSPNKFCCCRTGSGVDAPEVCVWWDKTCASSGLNEASLELKCENGAGTTVTPILTAAPTSSTKYTDGMICGSTMGGANSCDKCPVPGKTYNDGLAIRCGTAPVTLIHYSCAGTNGECKLTTDGAFTNSNCDNTCKPASVTPTVATTPIKTQCASNGGVCMGPSSCLSGSTITSDSCGYDANTQVCCKQNGIPSPTSVPGTGPGKCNKSATGIVNTFGCNHVFTQADAVNYACTSIEGQCGKDFWAKLRRDEDCSCHAVCENVGTCNWNPPGGGGGNPGASPTSGGGGGNGATCKQSCSGNLLQDCAQKDSDGTSRDSICNLAGRKETCGGTSYCCPTAGGIWTTDMTKCPTTACTQCADKPNAKGQGDADCSGTTVIEDRSIWRAEFIEGELGTVNRLTWKADFNCDGLVTIDDRSIWRAKFINSLSN